MTDIKDTTLRGVNLLRNPWFNKSSAFTEKERDELGLRGLLPPRVSTFDEQVTRLKGIIDTYEKPINKYIVLDISELTGDLLTVGMFVALGFVWDKAKENRTAEKAIFVDECWQLIGASSNRLAAEFVLEIFKIIRQVNRNGVTVLLVEQNAKMALEIANRAYVLETGKIKMEGEAHELANNIEVRKAYLGCE